MVEFIAIIIPRPARRPARRGGLCALRGNRLRYMAPSTVLPESFARAVAALHAVTPRPEIVLEDLSAPQRLAPYAHAIGGAVPPARAGGATPPPRPRSRPARLTPRWDASVTSDTCRPRRRAAGRRRPCSGRWRCRPCSPR